MVSNVDNLKDLLKKDSDRFLEDLKNSYLNVLDVGLTEKNRRSIIREIHAIKALSGIFELHFCTKFIQDMEMVVKDIIDLNLNFMTNDLLNDLFEMKDQVYFMLTHFMQTDEKDFSDEVKEKSSKLHKELLEHYSIYKTKAIEFQKRDKEKKKQEEEKKKEKELKNQKRQEVFEEVTSPKAEAKQEIKANEKKKTNEKKSNAKEETSSKETKDNEPLYIEQDSLIVSPSLLKGTIVKNLQSSFENLSQSNKVSEIIFLLKNVSAIDTMGIRFIINIQTYAKEKNIPYNVKSISEVVKDKAKLLGVSL